MVNVVLFAVPVEHTPMKKKSKSVDKFKCPFCPKMYVHKKTFEKHISTHE